MSNERHDRENQHRHTNSKLFLTKLTTFYDKLTHSPVIGQLVDITYCIFSKAFDTVSQRLLLEKLMYLSLGDLDDGIKHILMLFADDAKPSGEVGTLEEKTTQKGDLNRLQKWT
ncbi:hypothetical protein DUI87_16305 [Hirundo rustica rustica]|uniref:Reverse transcriptase domain-containing protein n=1 Tax=Hirundo rustica rustica TaxID=333673 RepID=A0A3M0K144_HIRRU|nr:hypothetical protein DUI87_16305 [Hirundo rustica rustica]